MSIFSFSISTVTPNYTFSLPLVDGGTYNFTVNWGDSNSNLVTTYNGGTHLYVIPGTYILSMTGTCTQFDFFNGYHGPLNSSLVEMVLDFVDMGFTLLSFRGCDNLTSISDHISNLTHLTSAQDMFNGCYSLLTIFESMFSGSTGITNFNGTFANCSNIFIQQNLPENIFANNTTVTSFIATFLNCTSLKTIPLTLFQSNIAVTNFTSTFQESGLTNLPSGLFQYNTTNTINFSATFAGCTDLQLNPYIFYLAGEESTRFFNKSVDFRDCFYECFIDDMFHGTAPDLWNCNFGSGSLLSTNCFYGAKPASLSNSDSIPSIWL